MNSNKIDNHNWYQAIALRERIALIDEVKISNNKPVFSTRKSNWQSQTPFMDYSIFTKRLEIDNISEAEFAYILDTSEELIQNIVSDLPDWLSKIIQAFTNIDSGFNSLSSKITQKHKVVGFLNLIEPLIAQGYNRLTQEINTLAESQQNLPFELNKIGELLFANLPQPLLSILSRTMVLELHVARLQGSLTAENSTERFDEFVSRLCEPEVALAILQEYPVLARQAVIHIEQWVEFNLEFLIHLCHDQQEIEQKFNSGKDLGYLVELKSGAGDTHCRGRSVLIATFSSGLKLVYKPRSLAVDVHFQELLTWLNQRGNHPPFFTLNILNRSNYGWVEFVTASGCNSKVEIERFYQRQGGYIALLYALKATDFHSENLIAAGEHPVLVDLESLFHPRIKTDDATQPGLLAAQKIAHSVISSGLLPQRIWANNKSIDVSGLGNKGGQLTPNEIPVWEGMGTDEMYLKRDRLEIPQDNNQPSLNESEIDVLGYTESITKGFNHIYQLLIQHREELLGKTSPLAKFANDEIRVILRSTQIYASLLEESWHPDLLRNALDRDLFFDKLWLDIRHFPFLSRVIISEQSDLHQGDIPKFTTRPNSRHLWDSSDNLIQDFLAETSLELVYRSLESLSDRDRQQQLWFIRASLTTLVSGKTPPTRASYQLVEPKQPVDHTQLLKAAMKIGDRLEWLAIANQERINWLGISYPDDENAVLNELGTDLYDGLPGIALFLAYLGDRTQKSSYTALAEKTLVTLQSMIKTQPSLIVNIGGFSGWGGIIYTLTNLGILWNRASLVDDAASLVKRLPRLISQDKHLDIIGGAAGCILSLINLYQLQAESATLDVAIKCGEHLVNQARSMAQGVGWLPQGTGERPLSGFSHGAAGIAYALLKLADLSNNQSFYDTAIAAIEYERSLFKPNLGNWLDLRNFSNAVLSNQEHFCMTAWCSGAPGIGLARLLSLSYFADEQAYQEINTALETTLKQGFGHNHSLCHGDLGNLELLLQASQNNNFRGWKVPVSNLSAIILESIDLHGCLCGLPLEVETPGLMTGLAGIGYQLLRLTSPEQVPAVLALESSKIKSLEPTVSEFAVLQ